MNILNSLLTEAEDRKRREDLSYKERTTGKGASAVVDRVIAELKGAEGGVWTRQLRRWDRLRVAMARMKVKKDELEKKFKTDAQQMFAAEDEVLTRVINTAEFSVLLKKQVQGDDTVKVEHELIIKELTDLMPELEGKIKELTQKYTTVAKGVKPASPTMNITKAENLDEGIVGDFWKSIKKTVAEIVRVFKSWGKTYDKKLNGLKKRAAKADK